MIYLKGLQDFAVTVGTVTLHLDEYCITGGALLRESGNAEGSAAVTALYPKGTRLKLKGKLAPPLSNFAAAGEALDAMLRGGTQVNVRLGFLLARGVRLIGFTLEQKETAADVMLLLYTDTPLEEVSS